MGGTALADVSDQDLERIVCQAAQELLRPAAAGQASQVGPSPGGGLPPAG